MSKDRYGFVVNRVLVPMINEAINFVYEGLATPQDVDEMMKLGANHPMGPLSLADLIGLDIVLDIMETLYTGFDDSKYRPSLPAEADVRRGLPRPQDRQGLLQLRSVGLTPQSSGCPVHAPAKKSSLGSLVTSASHRSWKPRRRGP